MKRISWDLPVFSLPNDKFYVTGDKIKKGQTPITETLLENETLPENNSYFIGTLVRDNDENDKLLCYHISDGNYIVVSYNRNTEIIFKDIIDIYNGGISIKKESDSNPTSVSIIDSDGTVPDGNVGV